jgi:hypothetical protein
MGYPFKLDADEIKNFNDSLNKDTKYYMLTNDFYDDLIKKQSQSHKAKYLKYIQLKKLQQY